MSNLTFDIKCIRADPQAGICESSGGGCCPVTYSQSTTPIIPSMDWTLISGIVQHIGGVCYLSMTVQATTVTPLLTLVATLPVGFRPTVLVGPFPIVLFPSASALSVQIDMAGAVTITLGSYAMGDLLTLNLAFPC